MYICEECKKTFEQPIEKCDNCGGKLCELSAEATMVENSAEVPSEAAAQTSAGTIPQTPEVTPAPVTAPTVNSQPAPVINPQPNPAPVYYPQVAPQIISAPAPGEKKVTAILGMIFGIAGLVLSVYHLIYAIIFLNMITYAGEGSAAFSAMLVMAIFMVPCSIVGMVMSSKPATRLQGMASAGKITSIISFGIFGLSMFLSFCLLFA